MNTESQESLFVKSLGNVIARGLTKTEAVTIAQSARRNAQGVSDAEKWMLLVGALTLGMSKPRINREGVEMFIKSHPKDAAIVAKKIFELTNERVK